MTQGYFELENINFLFYKQKMALTSILGILFIIISCDSSFNKYYSIKAMKTSVAETFLKIDTSLTRFTNQFHQFRSIVYLETVNKNYLETVRIRADEIIRKFRLELLSINFKEHFTII